MEEFLAKTLPFWEELTSSQKKRLKESAVSKKFYKGELVFNPLKRASGLKIVRQGRLKIFLSSGNGNEIMLYLLRENEICILSIMALMHRFNFAAYVRAEEDAEVVTLPEPVYLEIAKENPAVRDFNQYKLLERISFVLDKMSHAAWGSTEQRLAELLLYYYKDAGQPVLELTHEVLSEDIGTAREVISRTLKQFQTQGLIKTGRGKIEILDEEGLKRVKDGN